MKQFFLLLLLLLYESLSSIALAAPKQPLKSENSDSAKPEQGTRIFLKSHNISYGKAAALVKAIGNATGYSYFYKLAPSRVVGFSYFYGAKSELGRGMFTDNSYAIPPGFFNIEYGKKEATASIALLQLRQYIGSSFFLNIGLGQRRTALKVLAFDNNQADTQIKVDMKTENIILHGGFGHSFNFDSLMDGLFMDIDWLTYDVPLSKKSHGSQVKLDEYDSEGDLYDLAKSINGTSRILSNRPSYSFMVIQIGYSF